MKQDEEVHDAESEILGSEDNVSESEVNDEDPANVEDLKEYDPLLDTTTLQPLLERRDHSLKELLNAMDDFAPIIPDAVTDYYLAKAGLKSSDQRVKRLMALATQKFVSDVATDAYQYARIRSQTGTSSGGAQARGRTGVSSKVVLSMEDLSGVLADYGIDARRPEFYR